MTMRIPVSFAIYYNVFALIGQRIRKICITYFVNISSINLWENEDKNSFYKRLNFSLLRTLLICPLQNIPRKFTTNNFSPIKNLNFLFSIFSRSKQYSSHSAFEYTPNYYLLSTSEGLPPGLPLDPGLGAAPALPEEPRRRDGDLEGPGGEDLEGPGGGGRGLEGPGGGGLGLEGGCGGG